MQYLLQHSDVIPAPLQNEGEVFQEVLKFLHHIFPS